MQIIVDNTRCPQDHSCPAVKACPEGALIQEDFNAPLVNQSLCIMCKKCIRACPKKAIQEGN